MKKVIVVITTMAIFLLCIFSISYCSNGYLSYQEQLRIEQEEFFQQELNDAMIPQEWYIQDGHENVADWWTAIVERKKELANIASDITAEIGNYLTSEQTDQLMEISEKIQKSHSIKEIDELEIQAIDIAETGKKQKEASIAAQKTATINSSSSGNMSAAAFKSAGVIYMDGIRYTWYSQKILPGKGLNIPGRHADDRGFICDGDGYIVVASDFDKRGSIVATPFGSGKIYDSGAGANTRDLYTNF